MYIINMNKIKYIVIDNRLFSNSKSEKIFNRIFENSKVSLKNINTLILTYPEEEVTFPFESYFNESNISKKEIENKAKIRDIKAIFSHFSEVEECPIDTVKDRIKLGKQILYISTRTAKYIHRYPMNQECPGFLEGDFCRYCSNGCRYCFLNLTLRNRPIVTMYCDFTTINNSFKRLEKKGNNEIVNTGESGDMGNINGIFPEYWNIICEYAEKYNQTLLYVSKTDNIYDIPEATEKSKNNVYACSINTISGIDILEPETASYQQRIEMLKIMKNKGYRIAARFDPIFIKKLYKDFFIEGKNCDFIDLDIRECYKVLDDLQQLEVESIQFGMYRGFRNLSSFTDLKLPKNFAENFYLAKIDDYKQARIKFPIEIRKSLYTELINYVETTKNKRLCKEPEIHIKGELGKCICRLNTKK